MVTSNSRLSNYTTLLYRLCCGCVLYVLCDSVVGVLDSVESVVKLYSLWLCVVLVMCCATQRLPQTRHCQITQRFCTDCVVGVCCTCCVTVL